MKAFVVLMIVVVSAAFVATEDACRANIGEACESTGGVELKHCSAKYAGALQEGEQPVLGKLRKFAFDQLKQSFEFMLRASYFNNFAASRGGLSKVFRGMSDGAWTDAIDVIQLVAQRGGNSVFKDEKALADAINWKKATTTTTIAVTELESLGRALDSVKRLATEANGIHHRATHHDPKDPIGTHDAQIAHQIQEGFSNKYAKAVRTLAGYSTDLKKLLINKEALSDREKSLSLYLFDEYLLKQ